MIYLTRLNGDVIAVNIDLIEIVEETPDTIVTLTTGKKILVKESSRKIIDQIKQFKRSTYTNLKH